MATRQELQTKLEDILGGRHVYFQPPESTKMEYPAIVFSMKDRRIAYTFKKIAKCLKTNQRKDCC